MIKVFDGEGSFEGKIVVEVEISNGIAGSGCKAEEISYLSGKDIALSGNTKSEQHKKRLKNEILFGLIKGNLRGRKLDHAKGPVVFANIGIIGIASSMVRVKVLEKMETKFFGASWIHLAAIYIETIDCFSKMKLHGTSLALMHLNSPSSHGSDNGEELDVITFSPASLHRSHPALLNHRLKSFTCFLAGTTPVLVFGEKTWCIAKPSSDVATLLANINYACSQVDCSMIQSGHPCFNPDTPISHASIAMNLYYQAKGRNTWNCDFKNSGLLLNTNPSKAPSFNRFWIHFQRPVSFSSTSYGRLSSYQTVVMATVLMLDPCSRESPRPFGNKAM
ncbi:hypothetical protein IEQ34_020270 [Dendrobium chrysotoxum]|uniref:X8 domain-containing protein n=1 Tax=Dendrobium chrysotoxum TaxID=161865 RepID=A0AAV7G1G1_DENCH|nr:hypothetical protein IEQ34_020270 [Dendrobium chrysotoxum]